MSKKKKKKMLSFDKIFWTMKKKYALVKKWDKLNFSGILSTTEIIKKNSGKPRGKK